jgi:hypothetical protein
MVLQRSIILRDVLPEFSAGLERSLAAASPLQHRPSGREPSWSSTNSAVTMPLEARAILARLT